MTPTSRCVLPALLAALFTLLLTAPAAAQGAVTWAVQPSNADGADGRISFRYELEPGATASDQVVVTNYSDREVTFRLYAGDGVTGPSGAFDLLPGDTPPTDSGSWITLAERDLTLGPNAARIVAFTLTVPANATPGDHPAGIVAAVASEGGAQVSVERRVGARMHLRVGGEVVPRLELADATMSWSGGWGPGGGTVDAAVDVVNTGNLRLGGPATVELSAFFGLWHRSVPLAQVAEVLPGRRLHLTGRAEGVPPLIFLTSTLRLAPAAVGSDLVPVQPVAATTTTHLWAVPWFWLLVLLVAAGIAVLVVRHRRRTAAAVAAALEAAKEQGRREAVRSGARARTSRPRDSA